MIRKLLLFVAALALTPAMLAAQTAADYATHMQSLVGQSFGILHISEVRSEGDVLVVGMDGPVGWRSTMSPEQVTQEFIGGFCRPSDGNPNPAAFFDGRISIRVDTTEAGRDKQIGRAVDRCP